MYNEINWESKVPKSFKESRKYKRMFVLNLSILDHIVVLKTLPYEFKSLNLKRNE